MDRNDAGALALVVFSDESFFQPANIIIINDPKGPYPPKSSPASSSGSEWNDRLA